MKFNEQRYEKLNAETRVNHISSYATPLLHSTNIAKGERRGKRKLHFWLDYAEPPPIFYKYNKRRESDNNECLNCIVELLPLPCPVALWGVPEEI